MVAYGQTRSTKRLLALVTVYVTVSPLRIRLYPLYSMVESLKVIFDEGEYYEHLQTWEELALRFPVPW